MHGSLRVYRRQPFLPTSLSAWHAPRWKSWSRMLSLFLSLTFLLPSLTWAFDSSGYASAGSFRIVHQNKVVAIPAADGVVRTGWQAGDKLVVLIQDLHCNEEVQDHIARIIDRLAAENGIRFVGIEGAARPVNVSKLGSFPVSEVKAAVGRYLLQQGRIGGPEFYAATGAHPVRLEGIEDEALYRRNLDAARGLLTSEVQGYCCDLREALESLKSSVYNAPLLQFNAERKAYREGRRSLPDYALGLAKRARRQGWNLDAYPNLNLYLREPQAVFPVALDADALQRELDQLDLSLRAALYTSDEQRELDEFCRRADLIERLVNISATEQEVAEFQSARDAFRPQAFQDFIRRSADPEAGALEPEIGVLDFSLDQADGFYRTADRRSEAFVRNVLDRLQQRGETGAVLVTGGYHTGGILRALKARGVSCLAVTPRLRRQDVANPYYELLQNRRAPLEKLLEKNQTLLALPVRNPEVLPEGETAVLNEANAARYCADTRPETLGRIRTFFNLVQLLLELGLLERLARTGSSESLAERFREVLRDYAAQAGEFSLRLEGLPAQALSGLAALGRGGYGVAEVPVADKPFSVVVCPQGTLKTAEQTACIQFGRMDFVVMTRAQSARANLAERVSQASALLPSLTLPQGSAGLLLLTAGGALLQAGLTLRRTWAGARAGLRGGWIAGAAGAWNGLRISAEDALARIRRALPQGIPQSLHPARPALPAAVRSTAAAPLLEALELSDPERIPGAKPVGRWDREGLDVRRIELPAVAIAPDAFPKGVEFLQHELTQAKDRQAVLFDLLYEDNRLIAVFPVVDQERVPDFSAEGPERRLTAADQDAWGLRYLDLSPYYLQLPQPGDPNTAAILEEFARRQARYRSAIAAYKQVRFGPDLAGRIGPVKTDPDQPAGYPDNSYLYLELEPKTGRVSSYQVNLDDLIREPLPYDAEREQMLVPLYPTVYAPNTPTDQQYYSGITTELDLQRGERALVVGPGSGVDTWLTWRRTRSKVRAIGLNPLEVANVRAVAATAGFEVEAVNADNLIAEDGTPRFTGTFDAVLWDTPFIKDIQPAAGQRQLLEDMWDVDYKGRALRRFARGLSTVLKPGGQAWIWRGEDFRERVEAILRSGGETLDPALAALHPVLDVRAVHSTVCLAVKPEAAVTRGLGLTFGMTRALNRLLPSLFGGKGASERTLLHVAATRVAPWFEPVLTLAPLLAVQSIAVFFGQPLDAGWLIGLSALSHLGFVLSHWKGVYARLEQGSTVIPFGDIGSRAGWLGDRGRLTYWSRLFAAGLAFHLPFYLAFTGVLTGPSTAAFEHAFDLALPLAAVWAVFSHGIYNGLGLGRLNGLSERWLGLGPMDRWFARWRLPLGTMQVGRKTPSPGTEAERVPYDPRPVQSKLLHEYFVRFNQIVKAELNPEDRPLVGIYGGAGADIANYLLATNARTTYFVAEYPGLTAADLARLSEYRNYDRQRYGEGWKYLQSYAFSNLVDRKEGFLGALAYELEAIGVDLSTIRADRDGDNPRLQFTWQYAGAAPETYAVTFIDADITRLTKTNLENAARKGIPEKLAQVIRGGFDVYFQRAGWSLPKEYAAPDNYIFALYDNLNRQGAFITDDYAYGFNVKDMGSQFPIPLSERRIPGKNELAGRIIGRIMTKVREPGAYAPAETNPNYRYAWDLRMRVKTGSEEERREVARAFAERAEQTERLYVKAGEALKMSWRVYIGDLGPEYFWGYGFWGPILGSGLFLAIAAAVVYARLAKHAPYLPRFGRGEDMQGFADFDGGSGWTLSYTEGKKIYLDKEALRCLPKFIRRLFILHEEAHRDGAPGEEAAYRVMLDRVLGRRMSAPDAASRAKSPIAVEPLLEALQLDGPERIPGARIIAEWPESGGRVRRLQLPPRSDFDRPPKGADYLQCQLCDPTRGAINIFDLLYNAEGHLIGVFPVVDGEQARFRPPAEEGKLPEGKVIRHQLRYLDLSPYHVRIPALGSPNAREQWKVYAQRQAENEAEIQAYLQARFTEIALPLIEEVPIDRPLHDADLLRRSSHLDEKCPFMLAWVDRRTGQALATVYSADQLAEADPVLKDHKDYVLVPLYPSVYFPGYFVDRDYYRGIMHKLGIASEHRLLVVGPGSGLDTWLAARRTRRPVSVVGINPLEIANTRALAAAAGFRVETVVGDNVLDEQGRVRFTGVFDRILWNTPYITLNHANAPDSRKHFFLEDRWDGDYRGAALARFARGLVNLLKADGQAWIWRGGDHQELGLEILRSGGQSGDETGRKTAPDILRVEEAARTACRVTWLQPANERTWWGLNVRIARRLNRFAPRFFGGAAASEQTLLRVAATRVAPWLEPLLTLGPLLVVQSAAVALGIHLDSLQLLALGLVAHLGFVFAHWKGVYAHLENGPPGAGYIAFGDWRRRSGWLGERGRLTYWARLFTAGLAFHLPFYLAFGGIAAGQGSAGFADFFDPAVPLAGAWAVVSHWAYNRIGLGRWQRLFARLRLPLSLADGDPGFDARPVEAGLLHSIYIRHDMAVCRTLNPDHESRRAIYGGAGADLSNFLLSTDADEAYFVSDYQGLTAGDLERLAEYRDYDTERYSIWKFKRGYANGNFVSLNRADWPGDRSDDKERLLGALVFELSSLGVDLDSVRVDSDAGHPRIRFAWNYAGRAPRDYAITFIDGDITALGKITDSGPLPQGCPGKLREVVRRGFDFYYQRAGMGIPTAYRDSPSFIETLYAGMRPGGYFATDDYSSQITDNAAGMNYAAHFPLPLREIGIPGAQKLVSELHRVRRLLVQVSLHYDQLYPDGEDYVKEYGALIRVRQKPENASGTAAAPSTSARGTAAAPLLEALELSDPDRIPGAELLADWTLPDSGPAVRRIRLPARKDATALPHGIGFLQHELSHAPDGEAAVFDLLYREGRLLAVYPVLDKEIRRSPAGLNGGKQVTADEQEHWKLHYLDLSPYYLRLPQPGEPDVAARLRAFARRQAQDEQAIQNYHSSRFAPEVARRVAPLETDGHYPGAKYLLMQADRRDGSVAVDGISTHEIGDYVFPAAPGADRILVPLYPTVYAPNPPVDGEYYQGITNKLGLKKNDRVLVMGPGTGIDVWLVARRTAGRIRTVGLNPLEIASVKATAAAAGFEVEAKVGDNLIAPDGTPCFDGKFDKILWDTPAAVFGLKTAAGSKTRLQDLWDGDHEGDALKRFARGLPALLRPEGEGWIWLGEGFQEPVKAILRSGGKTADPDAAATLPETLRVEQVSYYTCRITRASGGSSADARNRLRGLFTLGPAGAFKLGTETVSTTEQLIDRAAAAEPSALDEIGNELNRLLNGRITEKRAAANKLLDIAAESRSGAASCLAVAALREALLRGDGETAEDAAAMLLQAVRKTQVAPEAAGQAFEALYAGAQNANPIIRHHAAAQLGKFLPEARTRTQLARRAADYFLSTLPKTDLHPLRVELWERGRVRSLVAYYAAAVLQTLSLALRKPPEAFPRKNLQPRSAAMKLRRLALEQMKPCLDFAGRTWVQGRTVITETGGNYYAFKLMKKSGERPEDLDYEYRVMDWLHRNRKALGLQGAYPRPVALNGDRAAQIAPEEFPREIRDALAVASREGAFEIARDIEDGSYTAICYAVEDPGYFRYLNDPAEIRTPEAFIAAARTNLHDTYVLARYGIVHTAVIGLFHNLENNRRYRWIEDLAELMRLNSRSTQESGAGRLHNPSAATRWPNARLTGIADMGDLMDVDQATRAGILADTMGNEDKDIRDRKLVLFNFLGEPRLALNLIYLDWLRQRGELDEESWKDDALIRDLTRFLRDEVYFETYRTFSGRAALSDEMKAVADQIDWKRFAVQLVYFMGGAYEEDLARETIPAEIYGPRTQVSLRNPEPAQSWGNIDTALIRNLAPGLVTKELLDHITDRYLNRRSSDRSVTVHQVKQHFNIMEIDADARIPALLKKPLKRLLIKHQYGWRSDGVDTDLGPFNGPNPLTEMILVEYLFSLAMLKDTLPARKDHAPDESTRKPAGLAGVTLEAARVLNRALPGLFGGKDIQADALVRIAATRVAPWFEPLLALAAPVFAAGLLLSLGVMPLLGAGAPWVLLGATSALGLAVFKDLHRDEIYVPGQGWVSLNDENRRAYLLKLLPVAVLTVVPWCVVLSGAALPVAATLAGPALALPLLLGAAFAFSAGGHWLHNRLALGALRPWAARLGLPLGMAGEDHQSAEDIRYLEGFYTALAATYQGKAVGASEFDRYVELEQAALAEAPADAKTVILQFYEMLLGNRIRQKEACGVLYQTAVESRSAAASELAISILQEAGRRGNDGLVRIALNELGLMLYDDNPNAAARARAQKAMEACLAGPREQVRWYSALKLLNSDAVLSDGVTRRIIDNFGLISMSDSSLVKDAAGGLKHLATDPGTNPKTAAQAVRLMEQWLTESRGFADSLVSRLQALAGQIGEIAVNPETPSDIARQAEEVLKHKLPLKLGLHPLRIELREEGNAPSLIAYFGKTLLRNPLPRLAPPQPFPLKEKKGALHKSDLPKISPAQLRLDLSGARVLGRTVIIERDGEHYALKLLKAGEALEELDYEHRVIEWVSRNSKALGLGGDERDYPAAVFGPGGERIARMSQGDIPAEVLKKLEAASATGRFGIDLQGGEYAYIAYKTADPDYFVYLNDPGVTPKKFKRATKKSLRYLNALAKFGVFHTSTITLFHNLDSLRRYLILVDAIAPMGRNGLKSSGAGRMHGFDEVVQYSNWRANTIADLAELMPLPEIVRGKLLGDDLGYAVESNVVTASFLGEYLLCWTLMYIDWLKNRGELTRENWNDPKLIRRMAAEMRAAFDFAFESFADRPPSPAMTGYLQAVDWERAARQAAFYLTGAYRQYLVDRNIPADIYGPDMPVIYEADLKRARGWGYLHVSLISGIIHKHLPDRPYMKRRMLAERIQERYLEYVGFDELPPALIGEIARVKTAFDPAQIDQDDVVPDKLKAPLKDLLQEYRHGWRADGIHEDLGPVNGPNPLTELVTALYLYSHAAIHERASAQAGDSGRGDDGRNGKRPETGIDAEEETGLSQELLRLHPWFNRSAWSRTNGRLGWRWLNAMGLSALLFPLFSAAQTTWGYLRTNGDAVLLGAGAVLGALTARVALRAAAQGTEPLRLTPDQKAGLRAGLGLAEGSNLGLVTASEVEARDWTRIGMPLVSYRERPGEGPCLVLADGLARRLADGMKAVPGSLRARLAERLFNRLSARALAEWTRSIEDQPAAAGRLGWPAAGIRSAEILILAHGAEAFTLTAAAAGAITGLILAIGIGLPVLAGTLSLGALAGAAAGLFAAGVTARFAPFLPYGERRKLDAVLRAFMQRLFGIAPSHRGKKHIWPSGPRSFLGAA